MASPHGNAMIGSDVETVFIVGERVFAVRESQVDAPLSMVVTVTLDGRFEWSFEEPGWRPLSLGASRDLPYLWSARAIITLPSSGVDEPDVLRVDEDLLYVFRVHAGWLLVCETSVRRNVDGRETDRVNFGDVVERARLASDRLWVLDASGAEHRLRVEGTRLTA